MSSAMLFTCEISMFKRSFLHVSYYPFLRGMVACHLLIWSAVQESENGQHEWCNYERGAVIGSTLLGKPNVWIYSQRDTTGQE